MGNLIDFNKMRNIKLEKSSKEIFENYINEELKLHDPKARELIKAEIYGVLDFLSVYEIPFDESIGFSEKQWEFINKYYHDLIKNFVERAGVVATQLIKFQLGHYK